MLFVVSPDVKSSETDSQVQVHTSIGYLAVYFHIKEYIQASIKKKASLVNDPGIHSIFLIKHSFVKGFLISSYYINIRILTCLILLSEQF